MSKRKKRGGRLTWQQMRQQRQQQALERQQAQSPSVARSGQPGRQSAAFLVQHQQQVQSWMSPTLPPQEIEQYRQMLPDAPQRFFNYMEKEQDHRHKLQLTTIGQVGRVQVFTFSLSALAIIGACICAITGHLAGLALALGGFLPLVQAVWSRRTQRDRLPSPEPGEHDG